jgi:uncharacterized protein (DUF934 family)
MAHLIKQSAVQADEWTQLARGADAEALTSATGKILVHVGDWLQHAASLADKDTQQIGIWFDSDDEPEHLGENCQRFALIAVNFPAFTDGRGYSIGRLIRERYRYQGELRAIGDVLVDQVFFMKRCGFDAFALREDKRVEAALDALKAFSQTYQGAVDNPIPLFRRRLS